MLLAALALAATGCGDTVSLDPVAKAADVSSKQSSEHMSMTATATSAGQTVTMSGEGDFQNDPNLGSMTMIVGGAQPVTMQAVLKDTTVYMTSGLFRGQLPGGKTWMSIDYGKVTKKLGLEIPTTSQSPADALAILKATGSSVTKVGTETIDGVATTHYTATVNPERAAKVVKALGMNVSYQPIDVWTDESGLVRRMHIAYSAGARGTLPGSSMDMTMTLSSYGETVSVAVPSAADTFDATKLAGSFLR